MNRELIGKVVFVLLGIAVICAFLYLVIIFAEIGDMLRDSIPTQDVNIEIESLK